MLARSVTWPRSARIQPFSDTTTVIGSRTTIASSIADFGLGAEGDLQFLDLAGNGLPLLVGRPDQRLDLGPLFLERLFLGADFHLFQLAQIAQAHVEDGVGLNFGELERLHQDGLGLVLAADDLDDLVEVEVGDQETAEHFQPVLDRRQPVLGSAHQHLAPMIEPFAQHFGQAQHFGDAAFDQHVHVERNAIFQLA
jgi:hypothetical protein